MRYWLLSFRVLSDLLCVLTDLLVFFLLHIYTPKPNYFLYNYIGGTDCLLSVDSLFAYGFFATLYCSSFKVHFSGDSLFLSAKR